MRSVFFAAEPFLSPGLAVLVNGLIKGSLLLAIAGLGSFTLRRSSSAARHQVWRLGLTSILLLPVASLLLPAWRVPGLPQAIPSFAAAFGFERVQPQPAAVAPTPGRVAMTAVVRSSAVRTAPAVVAPAAPAPGTVWLSVIWLAGAALVFAWFCSGLLRLWWIERRAQPVRGPSAALALSLTTSLGLRRRVTLLESRDVFIPLTWGLWCPKVLLPQDFESWPQERLRVVLSHELVHVKRGDCRIEIMAHLVCALYWLNPLVWLAARQLRLERERACDDKVLDLGARPTDYAGHLLDLARSLRAVSGNSSAAVAMARRSQLEGRLLSILDRERSRQSLSRLASAVALVVAICIVTPVAAVDLASGAALDSSTRGGSRAEALIAQLKDKDWEAREEAAKQLSHYGGSAAVEPLIAALSDEHWEVRKYAAFALVQIGDERAVDPLINALRDPQWDVREQASLALGQIGNAKAIEPLKGVLHDPDWHVREQAALALRRLESKGSTPAAADDSVASLLHDPDWRVRQQAVISMGLRGASESSLQLLFTAMRSDGDWHVREVTAAVLGRAGDPRAVEPLIAALKDADWHVRGQAANSLGLLGDRRAIEPLKALLQDKIVDVREDTQKALERLGG